MTRDMRHHASPVAPAPLAAAAATAEAHLSFPQRPMVQNVLPLITSLSVHLAILLIAWLVLQPPQNLPRNDEQQTIPVESTFMDGANFGGIPNPGLGTDPTHSAAQDLTGDVTSEGGWAQRKSATLQVNLAGVGSESESADTLIGIGATQVSSAGAGVSGITGDIAPLGVPGGGAGAAPRADFIIPGSARRVVYVCDATGTMLGLKFKLLQKQLYKAIDRLHPTQGFNVIFFKGGDSDADWANPFADGLVLATPTNKQRVNGFIERFQVVGRGTNPLPALRLAFAQEPQLIYFLSDGEFDNVVGYNDVLAEVRRLNAGRRVTVNTIAFMSHDPKAEAALQQMARENGGRFVKVGDRDLD